MTLPWPSITRSVSRGGLTNTAALSSGVAGQLGNSGLPPMAVWPTAASWRKLEAELAAWGGSGSSRPPGCRYQLREHAREKTQSHDAEGDRDDQLAQPGGDECKRDRLLFAFGHEGRGWERL